VHSWLDDSVGGGYLFEVEAAEVGKQILGLIPLSQICTFLNCAIQHIANPQLFKINQPIAICQSLYNSVSKAVQIVVF
jgi:hypothetical protein